jgi:hypothetical protein
LVPAGTLNIILEMQNIHAKLKKFAKHKVWQNIQAVHEIFANLAPWIELYVV